MSRSTWAQTTLGDCIATINSGVSVNSDDRPRGPGEIGVLKTSAVSAGSFDPDENKVVAKSERSRVAEPVLAGSVLFSRMNTPRLVGESCYVEAGDPSLFLPDRLWQIRVDSSRVDARWFSYALLESRIASEIKGLATGTSGSMKNIAKRGFLGMRIPTPSIDEQQRIAEILGVLDDQIGITEQIIAKLRFAMHGYLQDSFPTGALPSGWSRSPLGDLVEIRSGTTPSRSRKDYWTRGTVPWVKTGEVNSEAILDTEELITNAAVADLGLRRFPVGTILVAMYGQGATRGRVAILQTRACINQACAALQGRSGQIDQTYLFHLLRSRYQQLRSLGQGSNQTNLNATLLSTYPIPLPPALDDQIRIGTQLEAFDSMVKAEMLKRAKLERVRSGLIGDLITGRVRVLERIVS